MTIADYTLEYINGIPYLMPYGQSVADLKKCVKLNDTGIFIWNSLSDGFGRDKILSEMCKKYNAVTPDDKTILSDDLDSFLDILTAYRVFERENDIITLPDNSKPHHLRINTISICINAPDEYVSDNFSIFRYGDNEDLSFDAFNDTVHDDITINITHFIPFFHRGKKQVLRTDELTLLEDDSFYICRYNKPYGLIEWHLSKDGRTCNMYCKRTSDTDSDKPDISEEIFFAIRTIFLYNASFKGMYAIHSASVLYKDKAWLFSGHSGAGKSTHTNMWKELFNTPVINGDLNLIDINTTDGIPVVIGIPWCGTSGIYTSRSYPLGGITFIKKDITDQVRRIDGDDAVLSIAQRMISPCWNTGLLENNLAASEKIAAGITVFRLCCTKNPSSAFLMKEEIDNEYH